MRWKELNDPYTPLVEKLSGMTARELLRVHESATKQEIKTAYRKLMAITHPDKSSGFMSSTDQETAKLLNAAYTKLMRDNDGQ